MRKGILHAALGLGLLFFTFSSLSCGRSSAPTGPGSADALTSNPASRPRSPIRAAYFYSYMSLFHMDSLASVGINRALVKFIGGGLTSRTRTELANFATRAQQTGVELVPVFSLQATNILDTLGTPRRYTWRKSGGDLIVEAGVGCPADSVFWRTLFLNRALEIMGQEPRVRRLAVDLEIYTGSITHYIKGACLCAGCNGEYAPTEGLSREAFQLGRMTTFLTRLLAEFRARHPSVELGFFDLDKDANVHRAVIRGLRANRISTIDYCERSYRLGGGELPAARLALAAEGNHAPIIGGIALRHHTPAQMYGAIRSVLEHSEGYFIFTTFSLWLSPNELYGPYVIPGSQDEYWAQIKGSNRAN